MRAVPVISVKLKYELLYRKSNEHKRYSLLLSCLDGCRRFNVKDLLIERLNRKAESVCENSQ